jgi:hypothetical protein
MSHLSSHQGNANQNHTRSQCQWLTVILATQEAEISSITVWSQPGQAVGETLTWKKKSRKKGWWSGSILSSSPRARKRKKPHMRQNFTLIRLTNSHLWVNEYEGTWNNDKSFHTATCECQSHKQLDNLSFSSKARNK